MRGAGQTPLLELEDVGVRYGKFQALSGVNYRVYPGEVVCLLGGNASGKSTSMKTISGTTIVTGGVIRWRGQDITKEPTAKRMARGIGVVPEGRRVFATLTVRENLLLGAWGSSADGDHEAIDRMVTLFPPLAKLMDRHAGVLSGGEQQMVAFARALIKKPDLVIMDEPSMGLAPALVSRVFEAITTIKAQGVSIFVVEQNARAALAVADYAYVLAAGSVAVEGPPADVAENPLMKEAYLGKRSN